MRRVTPDSVLPIIVRQLRLRTRPALGQRNRQRKQAERGNTDVLNIHCDSLVNPWRNLIPHSVLAAQFGFKQRHINGPFHAGDHNGCECIAQHIYGHEGGR